MASVERIAEIERALIVQGTCGCLSFSKDTAIRLLAIYINNGLLLIRVGTQVFWTGWSLILFLGKMIESVDRSKIFVRAAVADGIAVWLT